jgi:hypothetical protein
MTYDLILSIYIISFLANITMVVLADSVGLWWTAAVMALPYQAVMVAASNVKLNCRVITDTS